MKSRPDPRVRSYLIHWLGPLGAKSQLLVERFEVEPDVTVRSALVLALGQFTEKQLPLAARGPFVENLLLVFANKPDAGLHGAAEWLLRKWGQGKRLDAIVDQLKIDEKQLRTGTSNSNRLWYVNTQKQTFVIMNAGEFLMGSPPSEPGRFLTEFQHHRHLGRRFAISAYEVTKAQFQTFQRAGGLLSLPDHRNVASRTDDSPQTGVSWYEAAHYCNWLSKQEGIPVDQWCYEPNEHGAYLQGMKPKTRFWELTGYRLPTESEWEYACRAGTVTSRYYGLSESLLPQYAWYDVNLPNRVWPVGSLKPNDAGLFDMQGNGYEWCYDRYAAYPEQADKVFEDTPTTEPVAAGVPRVLRGGSFFNAPAIVRSAYRNDYPPDTGNVNVGFRPARTYR
jgi:formylglycine-generating enzyme required for sulfatase activity